MSKKNILILLIIILLIIVLITVRNNKGENSSSTGEGTETSTVYNEVVDEETGETTYQVYDEETGEVIANTTDESMVQMYIDNPDFVGPETDSSEMDMENSEDDSIVSGSVWGDDVTGTVEE